MALEKRSLNINFAQGLDTKTDPFQVAPGKFLSLQNSIFDKGGLLQKRNGFESLPSLPDSTSKYATLFNGNLVALGSRFRILSEASSSWVDKGFIQPVDVNVLPLVRSTTNQSQADSAVSSSGLICTVYTDDIPSGGSTTPSYKYVISDAVTGQNIVAPTVIPVTTGTVTGAPKVFQLGRYFVIVFTNIITATPHLQYIAINVTDPTTVTANMDISSQYTPSSRGAFDGYVANNTLFIAWNGSDGGGAIRVTKLDSTLSLFSTKVLTGRSGTIISVTADVTPTTPVIYVTAYDSATSNAYTASLSFSLNTVHALTKTINSEVALNVTSSATNGINTIIYEIDNNYSYDAAIPTHYIRKVTITQSGTVGAPSTIIRSLGLASKAFMAADAIYFLGIYWSANQPTYFLVNSSGNIVAKLAYSNGGTYYSHGLPSVYVDGTVAKVAYLFKDLVQAVNKSQNAPSSAGIYSQTGINLATFDITADNVVSGEIGNNLHTSGGFLWMYDGFKPVEHGFFLYPDYVELTASTTGGLMIAQQYFYQVTYEWSDNQGNIFKSAPSIPQTVTTTGSTSKVTLNIPTLRLTYKIENPVKIVIYRWSAAQQTYYQVTSIQMPTLNDPTVDSISFVDTLADTAIVGNNILYTTGGVIENIAAPATADITLYQSRLWLIDAEDRNLLWYSKQVIEATPVEMSDLLTYFVAPTTGAQGSTGFCTALASMDDKLIVFKRDAIYYVTGQGPDNTGANNQYSDPIFITSTVGCTNKDSVVFMPNGIMFQSDKGIWLLGRDLSTKYIGDRVEAFNGITVTSAINVPGTNQVRFTLENNITLMYDYFYDQWGTFTNVPAQSSTLYENLHTYINSSGAVFQESPGVYKDGSNPVVMQFTTSWMNFGGLQGFQRAYQFSFLGTYISPHKLQVQIAYDYNSSPSQTNIITPDNYAGNYGSDPLWGNGQYWGGQPSLEQWQVSMRTQKCQAMQISIQELYDPTLNATPGAGLSLSGLDVVVGVKDGKPRLKASRTVG